MNLNQLQRQKNLPPKLNFDPKRYEQEVRLIPKDNAAQENISGVRSYTNSQSTEAIKQIQQDCDYNNQSTTNQSNTTQISITITES